ncbi:hypothetical protein OG921_24190 [Aldersonia sp. NBC_00410]|uniref:hypothetical protein n=1 Tax=Aldersonia sp. NBC_00410 TaxID=2975954 RepID=UPI00225564D9|nr:hypothetical protein [Aldersonia sp. NBC_00410]MCX5046276.1 hypothetical protein [Aldersonia sp. NBC_00410]
MSIPRPSGPYADEILGANWPSTDPDLLSQIAHEMTTDGREMRALGDAVIANGVGLLQINSGDGVEAMSAAMRRYGIAVEEVGDNYLRIGTTFDIMAWTIRAGQSQMAATVEETQAAIAAIETEASARAVSAPLTAAAVASEARAMIQTAVTAGAAEVAGVSASVAGQVSGLAAEIPTSPSVLGGAGGGGAPPPPVGHGREATTHGGWNSGPGLGVPGPTENAADASRAELTAETASMSESRPNHVTGDEVLYHPDSMTSDGQAPTKAESPSPTSNPAPPQSAASPSESTSPPVSSGGGGGVGATGPRADGLATGGARGETPHLGKGGGADSAVTGGGGGRDVTGVGSKPGSGVGSDAHTAAGGTGGGAKGEGAGAGRGSHGVTAPDPERSGGLANPGVRVGSTGAGSMPSPSSPSVSPSHAAPSVPTTESAPVAPRSGSGGAGVHGGSGGVSSGSVQSHAAEVRPVVADPAGTVVNRPPMPAAAVPPIQAAPLAPTTGGAGPVMGPGATPVHESPIVPPAAAAAAASAPVAIRDSAAAAFVAAAPASGLIAAPVNIDLLHAKTLLAGILAVPGALVTEWAVGVLRGGVIGAPSFVVTSTRGRGWLPRAMHLPVEVGSPWHGHTAADSRLWEGLADPTRIIAEYAAVMGERYGTQLMAIAASVPSGLRDRLPDEAVFGVSPDPDPNIDLTTHTAATMHRLQVSCPDMVDEIAAVDPAAIAGECLGLAWDAATRAPSFDVRSAEGRTCGDLRRLILEAIHNERPVQDEWWSELAGTDVLLDENARACRQTPAANVAFGALPEDEARTFALISAECAANEAVALLRDPDTMALADVYYAYRQLLALLAVEHPSAASPE